MLYNFLFTKSFANTNKLNIKTLYIPNKTPSQQLIKISFKHKCSTCTNNFTKQKKYFLAPKETKLIQNNEGIISKVISCNAKSQTTLDLEKSNGYYAINIQNRKSKMPNQFLTFDEALACEPSSKSCLQKVGDQPSRRLSDGVTPNKFLGWLNKLYERSEKILQILDKEKKQSERIPLIIHQIWFGKPMPQHYKQWANKIRKRHPGWKYICWSLELVKKYFPEGLHNQQEFDDAQKKGNYARMSDVLRYEVLEKFGGLYFDSDVQGFENFKILNQKYHFYAGLETIGHEVEVGNAIIASCAHHPVIRRCLEIIKMYDKEKPTMTGWELDNRVVKEVNETLVTTGPVLLTRAIWEAAGQEGFCDVVFPSIFFYCSSGIFPISFCKHYFYDTWIRDMTV